MLKKICCVLLCAAIVLTSGCSNAGITHTYGILKKKTPIKTIVGILSIKSRRFAPVYCKNASAPLNIETYDGSGQANHPKVLYFKKGFNKWKYWMSYTPYPNMDAACENPSIAVSNDGKRWTTPAGMHNPIVKPPEDASRGGYYSDPDLVMNGTTMELWYRYNPTASPHKRNNINRIYRMISKNGISWSSPSLIFSDTHQYFSPAVICDNGLYRFWYSDVDGKLHYRESRNLQLWSASVPVNLVIPGRNIWHQDVIQDGNKFDIVFCAFKKHHFVDNRQNLYYAESTDGLNFSQPILVLTPSKGENKLDNRMIYRSSLVKTGEKYILYYSAMDNNNAWHIFATPFCPPKSSGI